jgi:NDP-sugar pyrophosphorylase family protein
MSSAPLGGLAPEVLVMAGGEGRRLGALTSAIPKPMLPVGGRPVLQHLLEQLRDQGVQHVHLSVHHLSQVISNYFGDGRWLGIDIDYVFERKALGTAGAIGQLPAQSKPLLVINGDIITPVPIAALVAHHHDHAASMTVGHVEARLPVPYGIIECGPPDVLRLHEKPDMVLTVIAGIYLLAPEVMETVRPGVSLSMPHLIESVLAKGRVVGFRLPGPWLDIGTPDAYARADQAAQGPAVVLPLQHTPLNEVVAGLGVSGLASPALAIPDLSR